MNRRTAIFSAIALVLVLATTTLLAPAAPAKKKKVKYPTVTSAKLQGFELGVDDSGFYGASSAPLAIARTQEIGARFVRVGIGWSQVAPSGSTKPAGFNPRNPADPNYKWDRADAAVQRMTAAGFTVYVMVTGAPKWAQIGKPTSGSGAGSDAWRPSATEFGNFASAISQRYNGSFINPATGVVLPRVKIWQAWNEPNLPLFLAPTSVELYRGLLNAFYDNVKAVQPDSTVVTAGLAPVKSSGPAAFAKEFAESLLCVTPQNGSYGADPACTTRAKFDVFSVHPYSLRADPRQRAGIPGNMFVADVIDVATMVKRAVKVKTVLPDAPKQMWSTEFAWFTNPPNSSVGDPPEKAGTRTLIALYELWRAGLNQVTWYAISDKSGAIIKGGGYYDAKEKAKPTRDALRFPFYVAQSKKVGYVWGRAPFGATRKVFIQRQGKNGYKTVFKLTPRADGLFSLRFRIKASPGGTFRAQQYSRYSLPLQAASSIK